MHISSDTIRSKRARAFGHRGLAAAVLLGALSASTGQAPRDGATVEATESVSTESAGTQVTRRLFIAPTLPEDAVMQGILDTERDRLYIYRNPTRLEQWRGVPAASRERTKEISADSHASTPPLSSGRRLQWPTGRGVRRSIGIADPAFGGAILILAVSLVGLGWIDVPRVFAHGFSRVRPAPARKPSRASRLAFRRGKAKDKPLSTRWVDPWTPQAQARSQPLAPPPSIPESSTLSGSIDGISLGSVLQILANEKQTGALVLTSANHKTIGSFQFCKGDLVGVSAGDYSGQEAACRLLSIRSGFYQLRKIPVDANRGAETLDLMTLLLDAHRHMDEGNSRQG